MNIILLLGVPIIQGTDGPVNTAEEATAFCKKNGLPVIFKAAYGGGGRGMRVVRRMEVIYSNSRSFYFARIAY